MNRKNIKVYLKKHWRIAHYIIKIYNIIPWNNSLHIGLHNTVECYGILKRTKIYIRGKGNKIVIGELSRLINSKIEIKGNNNIIIIGKESLINEGDFFIEDDLGKIEIGDSTDICGRTHLACIEGCTIKIGNDCLFSSDVIVRTGDSHSIIDYKTQKRINPSKNVIIENHVWVGNRVTILKGAKVADRTVVGTGALVTKAFEQKNIIIAGNPAKIVKSNTDWIGERI